MAKAGGDFIKRFATQVGDKGEAIGILRKRGDIAKGGGLTPAGQAAAAKSNKKWGNKSPKGKEDKGPTKGAIAAKAKAIGGKTLKGVKMGSKRGSYGRR